MFPELMLPTWWLGRRLLRRLTLTSHGVDVADGGSKPPQPMASKQPIAAGPAGVLREGRLG